MTFSISSLLNGFMLENLIGGAVNRPTTGVPRYFFPFHDPAVIANENNDYLLLSQKRILIHELGHVIGLIHEHQRYDRDKYVKVIYENVRNVSQER